jgi:hypothetical protein
MLFGVIGGSKPLHPVMPSSLPIHEIMSEGGWGGTIELKNVNFNDFTGKTKCGSKQSMIRLNPFAADYIPIHTFKNS